MGFFDQGGGYNPVTGWENYQTPDYTPQEPPMDWQPWRAAQDIPTNPVKIPPTEQGPSIWDRIMSGVAPILKSVQPEMASGGLPGVSSGSLMPPPQPGGIGSDYASSGGVQPGVPMPQPNPLLGPSGGTAAMVKPVPLAQPPGSGAEPASVWTAPPMVNHPGVGNVPTFGQPAQAATPAPMPPGPPMNVAPPAAGGGSIFSKEGVPVDQQNFLQKLVTGGRPSGTLGLERTIAGIGKGMAGIQGNTKLGAFSRGFGGAIEGANEQQRVQFNQATQNFNNQMKMLLTDSTLNLHDMQAKLAEARQSFLGIGGKGGDSWRNTPLGHQSAIDTEVGKDYRARVAAISHDINLDDTQRQQRLKEAEDKREQERIAGYKRYGIDPVKGAVGSNKDNPLETADFKSKPNTREWQLEFMKRIPPGAYYRDQNGNVKLRLAPTAEQLRDALGANETKAQESAA